jgi:hypothetical protein
MIERVATVVPLPLSVVESNLWDVTTWTTFLGDVEWIERSGNERFVFGVRHGRRVHEVPVAVRWHGPEHRVVWRELSGAPWRGEISVTPLNGRRTRIGVEVTAQRRTLPGLLLGSTRRKGANVDLEPLVARLGQIPPPINPSRRGPATTPPPAEPAAAASAAASTGATAGAAADAAAGTLRAASSAEYLNRRTAPVA